MEEMCRAKGEWRCAQPPCPSKDCTHTSSPWFHQPECSLIPVFMYFFLGFTKQAYWLDHQPLVIDLTLPPLSAEVLEWQVVIVNFKWVFEVSWRPAPSWRYLESPLVTHLITYKVSKSQVLGGLGYQPKQRSNMQLFVTAQQQGSWTRQGPGIESQKWALIW